MLFAIVILLLGLFAATVGSLVGLSGGVFIVPTLLYLKSHFIGLSHITPQIAVGTSLIVVIFTSASSTVAYFKQDRVDYKSGLFFFLASGPGAILGAYFNQFLSEKLFHLFFGTMLFIVFYSLLKNKKMTAKNIRWHVTRTFYDEQGKLYEYGYHRYVAIAICFSIGVIQGLLGIGGGALLVPALILLFWYPPHVAVATSMFVILVSSLAGSISHILMENIDWKLLLWLAPGALLGGQLGAFISYKLKGNWLTYLLRGLILLLFLYSIWQVIKR